MSASFCAGRAWNRQRIIFGVVYNHIRPRCPSYAFRRSSSTTPQLFSTWRGRIPRNWQWTFRAPPPPPGGRKMLMSSVGAAALTPGAMVLLGEEELDDGKTGEEHMLEASRAEIDSEEPKIFKYMGRRTRKFFILVDTYIIEPLCTGLRFLHLVVIFVPVILVTPALWIGPRNKERDNERSGTLWWYAFLVKAMERAGPAFIKLGQWAASRTDVFPKEMCSIMSSLHSHAPAHSLRRTKRIISSAFNGRAFEDIFESFDETPLGVGAIAQVHRAKLQPDLAALGDSDVATPTAGEQFKKNVDALAKSTPQRVPSQYVAVKVLHPNVERIVRRDLRIMSFVANIVNAIPTMEWLSFPDEVQQFGDMMKLQLDLRIESANLMLFRKHFSKRSTAWFPYPYSDYSTRQVLVEEFAHGIPLATFLESGGGVYQKEIADEGLDAFLRMLLIDNFIHADLHPGNIMVRFYKPAKVDMPASVDVISRVRKPQQQAPVPSDSASQDSDGAMPQASLDETERVLSRLRPHKHDREAWKSALAELEHEGYRPQLIFIDTGLVTELNNYNRTNFLDLFKAVAEFDGYKAGELMVARCRQPDAVIDKQLFALRMQHLVLGVKSRTFALGNIKIGDVLGEVLDMVRTHHVRLEGDFVNVVLSILLLEGIGRSLDPNLDLFAGALPILRQLGAQSGGSMLRGGDFSMIKVWAGLEARTFLTASVEEVERCVKYDQLSPNV